MKKIVLLQSLQNNNWVSLEETKISIEAYWSQYCTKTQTTLEIINIDNNTPKSVLSSLLEAEIIVVASFNKNMAEWIYTIRKSLAIDARFAIYSYNMASIALAPLYQYKILDLLNSRDLIIVNCEGDSKILDQAFINLTSIKIPFYLDVNKQLNVTSKENNTFIYIGRISEQKNLHTLLWSFSKIKDHTSKLIFYGAEDDFGSPNMGKPSGQYLNSLKKITTQLNLQDRVTFKGFVKREEIDNKHQNNNFVFISPSLHADENFGLAAYRSLLQGKRAVLSSFGGHIEFQQDFSEQIFYTPVYISENGPYIDSFELTMAMNMSLDKTAISPLKVVKPCFVSIDGWRKSETESSTITITDFALKLFKQQNVFLEQQKKLHAEGKLKLNERVRGHQLFNDYHDPLSHLLYTCYGAMERVTTLPKKFSIAPWVEETTSKFIIHDFHKGEFEIMKDDKSIRELYSLGYISKIEE